MKRVVDSPLSSRIQPQIAVLRSSQKDDKETESGSREIILFFAFLVFLRALSSEANSYSAMTTTEPSYLGVLRTVCFYELNASESDEKTKPLQCSSLRISLTEELGARPEISPPSYFLT